MALETPIQYPCPSCGEPVDAVLHRSYVIDDEASLQVIVEQRFHVLDCGKCGEKRAFEVDFLVTNAARDFFVQVVTRDDQVESARASLQELIRDPAARVRIVASRNDLVEKVKLWKAKLDDVAMEVAKHFLRIQIKDLEGKTARFFERIDAEELVFALLSPGEPVRGMKLPLQVYRNIQRELDTPKYAGELEVDERLARRLLDARAEAQKKK